MMAWRYGGPFGDWFWGGTVCAEEGFWKILVAEG
jgi:uncharacterized RDD family membrane protein YckC